MVLGLMLKIIGLKMLDVVVVYLSWLWDYKKVKKNSESLIELIMDVQSHREITICLGKVNKITDECAISLEN